MLPHILVDVDVAGVDVGLVVDVVLDLGQSLDGDTEDEDLHGCEFKFKYQVFSRTRIRT